MSQLWHKMCHLKLACLTVSMTWYLAMKSFTLQHSTPCGLIWIESDHDTYFSISIIYLTNLTMINQCCFRPHYMPRFRWTDVVLIKKNPTGSGYESRPFNAELPADKVRWASVLFLLAHCLWCWANSKATLGQRLVYAGLHQSHANTLLTVKIISRLISVKRLNKYTL